MELRLLRVLILVYLLAGTSSHARTGSAAPNSVNGVVAAAPVRVAQLLDPETDSTEARWKREEVIRRGRTFRAGEETNLSYVTLVTVPILLLISLLAVARLRDF
jgi:hypothetical protein